MRRLRCAQALGRAEALDRVSLLAGARMTRSTALTRRPFTDPDSNLARSVRLGLPCPRWRSSKVLNSAADAAPRVMTHCSHRRHGISNNAAHYVTGYAASIMWVITNTFSCGKRAATKHERCCSRQRRRAPQTMMLPAVTSQAPLGSDAMVQTTPYNPPRICHTAGYGSR